jgi:type II restriction enzyme
VQLALPRIGTAYQSTSKQMGVLTEAWAMMNLSCPVCNGYLYPQPSGTPTLDFCCSNCAEEYQLKSSKRVGNHTILGARYQTTLVKVIQRTHPSIFFLTYNPTSWRVSEALFIHRAMISEEFVVGRAPLRETARREGYQGCTFDLTKIQPDQKLWLLKDEVPTEKQKNSSILAKSQCDFTTATTNSCMVGGHSEYRAGFA